MMEFAENVIQDCETNTIEYLHIILPCVFLIVLNCLM